MNNKRNVEIDIAKGIGILLVIIGHGAIPSWSKDAISSFHMPLFFILSGYFFRDENPLTRVQKDAKRLLLPYVVTMTVITLYMLVVHQLFKHDGWYYFINLLWFWIFPTGAPGGLYFSGPIWFLFALFWTKSTFNIIEKNHTRWFYPLIAFVAFVPFYIYYQIGIDLPLAISQGLTSIVFYWGGYECKKHELSLGSSKSKRLILLFFVFWILGTIYSDLNVMSLVYHHYPICILTAFIGTYLVVEISKYISKQKHIVVRKLSYFLSWGGAEYYDYSLCTYTFSFYSCNDAL